MIRFVKMYATNVFKYEFLTVTNNAIVLMIKSNYCLISLFGLQVFIK